MNTQLLKFSLILSSILFLSACQPQSKPGHTLTEVNGKTYLVNQETGKLSLIRDNKIIEMTSINSAESRVLTRDGTLRNLLDVNIKTKAIADRMYYKIELSNHTPETFGSQLEADSHTGNTSENDATPKDFEWFINNVDSTNDFLTLSFKDKDSFEIFEHTVTLKSDYISIFDVDGVVQTARYEGSFKIDPLAMPYVTQLGFYFVLETLLYAPE